MTGSNSLLSKVLRCLVAIIFLSTTTLLVDAAVILSGEQEHALQQQQQNKLQQSANRTISATLFAELEESARLADIAYCVGTAGIYSPFECLSHCDEFKGFELITTWNTGPLLSDSCGYIALSHPPFAKRIIIAFRGTYSLTNTIVDLSAVPQTYVPYPEDGGNNETNSDNNNENTPFEKLSIAETKKCHNCTVHAGFWTSWKNSRDTVLSSVTQARQQYPDYEVTLIGHSLGGAVAALASIEMYARGMNPRVTTFGEPKIGNDRMAEYINAIFDLSPLSSSTKPVMVPGKSNESNDMHKQYRRVTHVNDPVPLLPLTEWGYAPHAGEIYISKLDIPLALTDIELCTGNSDKRCIASAEAGSGNGDGDEEGKTEASSLPSLLAQQAKQDILVPSADQDQLPLSTYQYQQQEKQHVSEREEEKTEEESVEARWLLVPARYRMWELFFAHRDYFLRIGLCVPGGDPSSWRWLS